MLSSASRRSAQPHNGESGESEETGGIEKLCAGLLWLSLPSGHPSPAPWQAQGCLVLLNPWNSTSSSSASHSLPADGWSPTSQAHAPLPVPISATLSPASLFFSPWASHHSTCGVCSSFHVPLILNSGTVLDSKTKGANSKHQSVFLGPALFGHTQPHFLRMFNGISSAGLWSWLTWVQV